ncbi:MAG: hypothetical protein WBY01_12205, partial [Pseudolabrys sp.]
MPLPVTRKLTLRGLGSINANAVYRAQLAQRWRVFLRALVIWQAAKYPKTGPGCWRGLAKVTHRTNDTADRETWLRRRSLRMSTRGRVRPMAKITAFG